MNGIENITQRIDREVQAEIDRILSEGQAAADRITAGYREQGEKLAAELAARNRKAAAQQEERLVSVAQMEARKITLSAKQEMVEEAFRQALDTLCALPDSDYIAVVTKLLKAAATDGTGEVILTPERRASIGTEIVQKANQLIGGGKLTLSEQTRPMRGGFLLVKGNVEVNGTFETLMRLQKDRIAGEAASRLFPEA